MRPIRALVLIAAVLLLAGCAGQTSRDPIQSDANVFFNGDFRTGDWSQWDSGDDDCRPQDHSIVTSPGAPAPFQFTSRFTVTPDSGLGQAGTRCLVYNDPQANPSTAKSHAYEGAESWYQDYQYFPADFQAAPSTDWNWTWQIHNAPDGCSNVMISLGVDQSSSDGGGPHGGERLSMRVLGGGSAAHPCEDYDSGDWDTNPDIHHQWIVGPSIVRDHWYRIVVHVKWSLNPAVGLVEYYLDNQLLGTYHGPTLLYYRALRGPGQGYLTVGYYRSRAPTGTATVYHAGTRVYAP